MKDTKASHVAAREHRFLYGGLVSPKSSKSSFNNAQNVPETTDLIKSHSFHPLIPSTLPDYPWQQVAADLFQLKGSDYIVIVDYFSRYPEVHKLTTTTSKNIINSLKTAFACHGIPETLRTDNGPQFNSIEFTEFAKQYDFTHTTSSPHFPASKLPLLQKILVRH